MADIDIESEEGAQEKVDAHEELDNPHPESASMADLEDVGGRLDLIHVATPSDLPPFNEVSNPTIAYIEDVDGEQNDDYAAIFKS